MEEITVEIDFLYYLKLSLRELCEHYSYDWFSQIKAKPTVRTVFNSFCRVTNTFFFHISDHVYFSAEFSKKEEMLYIRKCGKGYKEKVIKDYTIQEFVDYMVGRDDIDGYGKENINN